MNTTTALSLSLLMCVDGRLASCRMERKGALLLLFMLLLERRNGRCCCYFEDDGVVVVAIVTSGCAEVWSMGNCDEGGGCI